MLAILLLFDEIVNGDERIESVEGINANLQRLGTWATKGVAAVGISPLVEVKAEAAFLLTVFSRLRLLLLPLICLDGLLIFLGLNDL
jgi:hypothetical protein